MSHKIDLSLWLGRHSSEGTGLFVYAKALLPYLLKELEPFASRVDVVGAGPEPLRRDLAKICAGLRAVSEESSQMRVNLIWKKTWTKSRRLSGIIDLLTKNIKTQLFHGISNTLPLSAGNSKGGTGEVAVVTLHDLLQPYPTTTPSFPYGLIKQSFYQWYYRQMISRVSLIFTGHEKTAAEIKERYPNHPPVVVVYPPLAEQYFDIVAHKTKSKPQIEYLLTFVSTDKRKNFKLTFEAFKSTLENSDLRLAVVCGQDQSAASIRKIIQDQKWQDRVHIILKPRLERLIQLYDGATGTLFASLGEGFGYPIYESLARGVPVLTSKGLLAEPFKVSRKMVIECDPTNKDSIAQGILDLLKIANEGTIDQNTKNEIKAEIIANLHPIKAAQAVVAGYQQVITK